jgi:hypothetical protein
MDICLQYNAPKHGQLQMTQKDIFWIRARLIYLSWYQGDQGELGKLLCSCAAPHHLRIRHLSILKVQNLGLV